MPDTGDLPIDAADQSNDLPVEQTSDNYDNAQHDESGQTVPVAVVQRLRSEMQNYKQQTNMLRDQYELMKNFLSRGQTQQQKDEDEDDDEPLTRGQAKKWYAQTDAERRIELQEYKVERQYPDYQDVVRTYLPQAIKDDPSIADIINLLHANGKNAALEAYKRAKESTAYRNAQKANKQRTAGETVAKNADRPPNLSHLGKAGAAQGGGYFKNMDKDKFRELVSKNCGEL